MAVEDYLAGQPAIGRIVRPRRGIGLRDDGALGVEQVHEGLVVAVRGGLRLPNER